MPDIVDVVRLDVRANRAPTITGPQTVTTYEGQAVSIGLTVTVGYPRITDFSHQLQDASRADVSEGSGNPTIGYTELTWSRLSPDTPAAQNLAVGAPTLAGDSPLYVDWFIVFTVTSTFGTDSHTVRLRVYQEVAATVSFPEVITAYEGTNFHSDALMFNAGSPLADRITHAFYGSTGDAGSKRNPITSGRPTVIINPTEAGLDDLAGAAIRERQGSITYGSALPNVNADTDWYGRIDIEQTAVGGNLRRDYAIYQLRILNAVAPTLTIPNFEGIEGQTVSETIMYISGAPYVDRFAHVGFYASQADAQNDRNKLTRANGIPRDVTFSPATPAERTGSQTGALSMRLPYVTADKTVFGVARLERDRDGGGTDYWRAIYDVRILNRVPAQIDVQEIITMDEQQTMMIMFTYTRGVPSARGYSVSIHDSFFDAENDRNPVMAADDPRITLSAYDNTGSMTAQKTGTATIVSPDISVDTMWWPRFEMDQDAIGPDGSNL